MYLTWRMLIYFVFSLLCKKTNSHSPSEQIKFAGLILALKTEDYNSWTKALNMSQQFHCGDLWR